MCLKIRDYQTSNMEVRDQNKTKFKRNLSKQRPCREQNIIKENYFPPNIRENIAFIK